jgi:hypothetical protein
MCVKLINSVCLSVCLSLSLSLSIYLSLSLRVYIFCISYFYTSSASEITRQARGHVEAFVVG